MNAMCCACNIFYALNLVGERDISILNYKTHVFRNHVEVTGSLKTLTFKEKPKKTSENHVKITSFFTQTPEAKKIKLTEPVQPTSRAESIEDMEFIILE